MNRHPRPPRTPRRAASLVCALVSFLFCSALPSELSAQEPPPSFSSVVDNLDALENLIAATLNDNETLTQQLLDLKQNLSERETILIERATLKRERENADSARKLVERASATAHRNVVNLQGAVGLIREIRTQIQALEDFYADRDTGGGAP